MKSKNILVCLFAITLCTSICIAETYTTNTKTYYQPTKTVTTTVIDDTTNPMYSVQRNDKIQNYLGTQTAPKTVTTTTTTEPTTPYKKVTTTTVKSPSTVKTTVVEETTNPVYSANKNDKIKTTVKETQSDLQKELSYYESLKTCSVGSMNSEKLSLRTYGMNNGLCNFDMAMENPKTSRMVTVCSYNAPLEATKKFAEDKILYTRAQAGLEKLNTSENTALSNSLTLFTQKYCK